MSERAEERPGVPEGASSRPPGPEARRRLERRGYVVRGLLSRDRVARLSRHLNRLSGLSENELTGATGSHQLLRRRLPSGWTLPDGVTKHRDFWPVIFHSRLLRLVRSLLGPDVRFLQHSDLHVGYSSFNWHRDSVSRTYGEGADWEESKSRYAIVRVGIYLRVPEDGSFRLGLVPGTHRPPASGGERQRRKVERYTGWMSHVYRWVRGENAVPPGTEWVAAEPGDAVIFDPRVIHTGTPVTGPKCSLFLAYGLPNRHSANHVHYYRHLRPELGYEEIPEKLAERLRAEGLYFDPDPPEEVAAATTENRLLSWLARLAGVR